MKKFLSVILAIAMVMTLVPTYVFANNDEKATSFVDVEGEEYYAQAAEVLSELGVLKGYEEKDGFSFGADKAITRAEMATIVCRMIGKEDAALKLKGKTDFDDVDAKHWASGYINYAAKNGIVNGYGNGKFMPEANVKFEEAIKMIVCAFGYGDGIKSSGNDWAKPYIEEAEEHGITDNLEGEKGKAATRGDVAVMVFNGESEDVEAPAVSVEPGKYDSAQYVQLTCATKDAEIYYTLDGSEPTITSKKYENGTSISVSTKVTLKAITVKKGVYFSDVTVAEYDVEIKSTTTTGGGGTSKYTVSFNLNYDDAEGAPEKQKVKKGECATEPEAPVREGYVFVGWSTKKTDGEIFDFETAIKKSIKLYAIWEEVESDTFTVSFDLNYEGATGAPESQNIAVDGKATLPAEPTRTGFTFTGWATSSTGETMWNFAHFVTESMTLYAIWATDEDVSLDTPDPDVEIYSFDADTYKARVGEETTVVFTAEVFANVDLEENDIYIADENSNIIGYMNDNGEDGDAVANDGIYTLEVTLSSDAVTKTRCFVVAKNTNSDKRQISFYKSLSTEEAAAVDTTIDEIDAFMAEYVQETIPAEEYENVLGILTTKLEEMKNANEIEDYFEDEYSVRIALNCGTEYLYLFNIEGSDAGRRVHSYQPAKNTYPSNLQNSSDKATDGSARSIADKFSSYEFDSSTDGSELNSYNDDNFDLGEVSIEAIKNISAADVVAWHGHGGYNERYGSFLALGVNYEDVYDEYKDDFDAGFLLRSSGGGVLVTGGFIQEYCGNMSGSLLYLGACCSAKDMLDNYDNDYSLVQAFINKGAAAVVANSGVICTDYNTRMETDTFKYLCRKDGDKYYTLSDALNKALHINGNGCSEHRVKPMIFPQNDEAASNYRLYEESMGNISGKVMSAANSDGIRNALVRVYQNNELIESVRTDAQGNYNVKLPVGDYIVKITAGDYKSAKMSVTVTENNTTYTETFLLVKVDEEGVAKGIITNALNAQLVPGVTVKVRNSWNNQTGSVVYNTETNDAGYYEIEYIPGLYTMEFSKEGYITGYKNIVVGASLTAQNAVISPVMSDVNGEYRFVLSWRERPNDLDSHLTGPMPNSSERFHLYYPLKDTNGPEANPYREYATLDWDNTRIIYNSDPETITLHKQIEGGVYRYSVHDFTNGGDSLSTDMANSNAKVDVYKGSMLIRTYHVPNVAGTIWTVFELTGDTLTDINRVGNGRAHDATLYGSLEMFGEPSDEEDEEVSDEECDEASGDEDIIVADLVEKE